MSHTSIPLPHTSSPSALLYTPTTTTPHLKPAQQPHTTPIAHFVSSPNTTSSNGALLDVNSSYIVYAVKNGLVRVIDRHSASRTLLRGHSKRIGDVSFFGSSKENSSDVLGTIGGTGDVSNVLIWRVYRVREEELQSEKLLEIRSKDAVRFVWHPFNPNIFVLLHGSSSEGGSNSKSRATLVETTKLYTAPHGNEGHAVCVPTMTEEGEEVIENALRFLLPSSAYDEDDVATMADLTWSNLDSRHVLSGQDDGSLILWDLRDWTFYRSMGGTYTPVESGEEGAKDVVASAKCLFKLQGCHSDVDGGISRVVFLPPSNSAGAGAGGGVVTCKFVASWCKNTKMTIWSEFTTNGSQILAPTPLQTLEFFSNPSASLPTQEELDLRLSLCGWKDPSSVAAALPPPGMSVPTTTANDSKTVVLLADQKKGDLYALSLSPSGQLKYITPFKVVHPIYSFLSSFSSPEDDDGEVTTGEDGNLELNVFCVQSKAVQLLRMTSKMMIKPTVEWNEGDWGNIVQVKSPPLQEEEEEEEEVVEYDDYDPEEDEDMMMHSHPASSSDDDEEEEMAAPPPGLPPQLVPPPPHLETPAPPPPFGFANWLGSLAAASSSSNTPPPPVPPGVALLGNAPPPATATAPPPGIPLPTATPAPPPPPPGVMMRSSSATSMSSSSQTFLNPMELLPQPPAPPPPPPPGLTPTPPPPISAPAPSETVMTKPPPSLTTQPKAAKKSKPARIPTPNKSSKPTKKRSKSPNPRKNNKDNEPTKVVAILKRADGPTIPTSTSSTDITTTSTNQDGSGRALSAPPKSTLEIANTVNTSSKELHSMLQEELSLSSTKLATSLTTSMEQLIESKITKPLQSSIVKSGKESSKVRTREVVEELKESVKEPLVQAFRQTMKEVMIPAYEAATKQIFTQISSQMDNGLQSLVMQQQQQLHEQQRIQKEENEKHAAKSQQQMELLDGMMKQMTQMNRMVESLSKEVVELRGIVGNLSHNVGGGYNVGGMPAPPQHQQPIPQRPTPPPPQRNEAELCREEILAYIRTHQYEQAFTKALSASKGEYVVFACKHADLSLAFGNNNNMISNNATSLSQPILLCLMQQLGAVLITSYDKEELRIELAWLQEIAVSLDTNHESIRRHVGQVLQQLVANINAKMAEGDMSLRRPLQTLLQVIRGMGETMYLR
mmetsp:Transcript_67949/g.100812  ORF Transcript_67949/g.100812 Transcript_67949/m.100812 type:complete len:1174 (+) Transcript_67949:364-3885(+)